MTRGEGVLGWAGVLFLGAVIAGSMHGFYVLVVEHVWPAVLKVVCR